MQTLSCNLWLMEQNAFRQFQNLAYGSAGECRTDKPGVADVARALAMAHQGGELKLSQSRLVTGWGQRIDESGPNGLPAFVLESVAAATGAKQAKSIAVVPVIGGMEARPTYLGRLFGMTSYAFIGAMVQKYAADETVSHIVLDMATPGGMVYGCQECAQVIYELAGVRGESDHHHAQWRYGFRGSDRRACGHLAQSGCRRGQSDGDSFD